jgi:pheromone shutdown protein TraB
VARVVHTVRPQNVVVELCRSRFVRFDETLILSSNPNLLLSWMKCDRTIFLG